MVNKETYDKINELAKILQCPKAQVIEKLAVPVFEVACNFESAKIESYPMFIRSNCLFQVYGNNPRVTFGKRTESLDAD